MVLLLVFLIGLGVYLLIKLFIPLMILAAMFHFWWLVLAFLILFGLCSIIAIVALVKKV